MRSRLRLAFALIALVCACHGGARPTTSPAPSAGEAPPASDARVVIFVIDGPRWSETFGDSLHAHIPGMWNQLRPQGTLCTNFRNEGLTLTNPGHGTILTGVWQHIDNHGKQRPLEPTLFEYYRKARNAAPDDAVIISVKDKLAALAYGLDPDYGAAYGASTDLGQTSDVETYAHLIDHLDHDSPHLVMASFSQ
ncbi:MAG TPA: hypothetical protein VFH88_07020, partial [Candidatus Krumholzibacteria bacterium]|nr:hypothetical protein [Candidatus Krumholzibacteria bacterium]